MAQYDMHQLRSKELSLPHVAKTNKKLPKK